MNLSLITFNCRYTHSSLALFYLRGELRRHLPEAAITLHQFTINDPYYATLAQIAAMPADALFFSVSIWNDFMTGQMLEDLVLLRPHTPLVLGGPQARTLLDRLPATGRISCVSGEIEGIDNSFYSDLRQKSLAAHYHCGIPQASSFPSPYQVEDFSGHLADRAVYYESSRGCPYSCSYCLSATENGIRAKSLEQVQDELRLILRQQPRTLRFVDRTFNVPAERALAIWRFLLLESGDGGTTFHFEIAPDLLTADMLAFLGKLPASLFQFEIGIQSTNAPTLAAINRVSNPDRALAAVKSLTELDRVHVHLDLILGLPHDTTGTFARSFRQVFATAPHYIQMGLLKILPDTPLAKQGKQMALQHRRRPPYEILATPWLPHEELIDLFWFGECVEAFYNNRFFRSLFNRLRRSGRDIFAFFHGLLRRCRDEGFFQRAATQELKSRIMRDHLAAEADFPLLLELLRYDWLRSGQRFLPSHLDPSLLNEPRDRFWKELPEELAPHYSRENRSAFFRKSLFLAFSPATLEELGLQAEPGGVLCFLTEKEDGVEGLTKVIFVNNTSHT